MANHVSSLKRARQTITKTAINRANKSKLRGTLRLMREALLAGDKTNVVTVYRATVSVLDKSVQKGVLHKNTASRYKGRLNARVKAVVLSTAEPVVVATKAKAPKVAAKSKAKAKA
jgi:small subunit ribosomal protein S20